MPDDKDKPKNEATKPGQTLSVSSGKATRITVSRLLAGTKTCKRLNCECVRFNNDSAIVMHTALRVIAWAIFFAHEMKDGKKRYKVLLTSHTDRVNSAEENQLLSDARSKGVMQLMTGDMKGWVAGAARANRSLAHDIRMTLAWAQVEWGLGEGPDGDVDNRPRDAKLDAKVTAFNKAFDAKFTKKNTAGELLPGFWMRVCNLYARRLMSYLKLPFGSSGFEPLANYAKSIVWLDDKVRAIGCGERFNLKPTEDETPEPVNRRTEFLFFEDKQEPLYMAHEALNEGLIYGKTPDGKDRYKFEELNCPEPKDHFFGLKVPPNVVFVIDFSSSMEYSDGSDTGGKKAADRIGLAKHELTAVIKDLPPTTCFGVITYNDPGTGLRSWPMRKSGAVPCVLASEENRDAATKWLNGLHTNGYTGTGEAMALAFRSTGLTAAGERGVMLLSDGAPKPGRKGKSEDQERDLVVAEVAEAAGTQWRVDAIGFFDKEEKDNPKDELVDFMKQLPRNGGQFKYTYVPWTKKAPAGK